MTFCIGAVPRHIENELDEFQNSNYQGTEGNRPQGQCGRPKESRCSWMLGLDIWVSA